MNELERKPYSSESLRVRCPHCRKLYMVQFGDLKEAKPRFECIQCHNRFWLSLPEMDLKSELQGIPVQIKDLPQKFKSREASKKTEPCPKCFKLVQSGIADCPYCGVVIDKVKSLAFQEGHPAHSESLNQAWKKVISNYGDDAVHSDFLRIAQRESNLPFAAAQYSQMQKLMPGDETTLKRMGEVQALGSIMVPAAGARSKKARAKAAPSRLWQVPLAISAVMMGVGIFAPILRNIVGVGAAFFFLALALQIEFRRRDER